MRLSCESVARFLAGSTVLVAECSLSDPPPMDLHLSPEGLARLAEVAGPELLIVTHVLPHMRPEEAVRLVRRAYGGRVEAGVDGIRITLGPGDTIVDRP